MRKVVYVAGPIRAYNPDGTLNHWAMSHNLMRAMAVALAIWRNGHAAIVVHASTPYFQGAASDERWLEGDLAIIARCDAVVTVPNWETSVGSRGEVAFAEATGIPVFHNTEDFFCWSNTPLNTLEAL